LKIGTAEATPGSKAVGYIAVADYAGGIPILVPVILFQGIEDGPTLWIEAMIHGDEYQNSVAVIEYSRTIDPRKLRGSLVMIPAVNIAAVQVKIRETSVDHSDLFYSFPGSPDAASATSGPPSLALMWSHFWFELITPTANFLIDLHGGGLESEIADVAMYPKVGIERTDALSRELAMCYGYRYLISHSYHPDTPNWFDHSLVTQCALRGIPCALFEFPGPGGAPIDNREIERACRGMRNIMKHLKMIEGSPERNVEHVRLEEMVNVATSRGGFIHSKVKLGQRVVKGETLATVTNFFGEEVEEVKSPIDGVVTSIPSTMLVGTGSWPFEMCHEVKGEK